MKKPSKAFNLFLNLSHSTPLKRTECNIPMIVYGTYFKLMCYLIFSCLIPRQESTAEEGLEEEEEDVEF
jgi:hypothetical protein